MDTRIIEYLENLLNNYQSYSKNEIKDNLTWLLEQIKNM